MGKFDNSDKFIADHYASMSMREMADHLGISKSTVSRRAKALREAGKIDEAAAKDAQRETQRARDDLRGCTMSRGERLRKLDSLRARLEDELDVSGGGNLSRVSSEYRKTLEEIASLSANIRIDEESGKRVSVDLALLMGESLAADFRDIGRDELYEVMYAVLGYLNADGVVKFTAIDKVKTMHRMHYANSANAAINGV